MKFIKTIEIQELKNIRKLFGRDDIYFVAYNNFGYDQIILENNFKICNIKHIYLLNKQKKMMYFFNLFSI